jgi:hypothetical protein
MVIALVEMVAMHDLGRRECYSSFLICLVVLDLVDHQVNPEELQGLEEDHLLVILQETQARLQYLGELLILLVLLDVRGYQEVLQD